MTSSGSSTTARRPSRRRSRGDAPGNGGAPGTNFAEELQSAKGVQFSKHAAERVQRRGMTEDPQTVKRLENGVDLAASKGSRAAVVMVDDNAFVVAVPNRTVITALDHRRDRIKSELDDARRLKDEAAKLLADYKARQASAEREAQDIVTAAKAEAERIAAEAKTKMEDFVARRTKTAEGKIALAEAQAIADVRAAAANAAVAAATSIMAGSVKGEVADDLLSKGIAEVRAKLN